MRFAPGDIHASWSAQYRWCTEAIEIVLAPSWNGTPCSSYMFGNIVLLRVALQGRICCLSGCLFIFSKSDESSFVGFGCVVIFISFQVLSLFLLAHLFVLKVLFVLGIDVWERFVSFPWVMKAPGIFIVLMNSVVSTIPGHLNDSWAAWLLADIWTLTPVEDVVEWPH